FDVFQPNRHAFQKYPSFSDLSSMKLIDNVLQNGNDDDEDDDEFLVNSSLRTYTQLNNSTLPSVQVPPSLSNSPSPNPSATTLSTYSNSFLAQLSTPSAAAAAVYNKLLKEQPLPSSPAPKKTKCTYSTTKKI
ncbi:unnamed protein product, partial [Rotaria sp. Silwood2]